MAGMCLFPEIRAENKAFRNAGEVTSRIAGGGVQACEGWGEVRYRLRCWGEEDGMGGYPVEVEGMMRRLFESLSEKDRRRYAAVEAAKLGHGGLEYVARVLGCDPKTIRQGRADLGVPEDPAAGRVRKKGAVAEAASTVTPTWRPTS